MNRNTMTEVWVVAWTALLGTFLGHESSTVGHFWDIEVMLHTWLLSSIYVHCTQVPVVDGERYCGNWIGGEY